MTYQDHTAGRILLHLQGRKEEKWGESEEKKNWSKGRRLAQKRKEKEILACGKGLKEAFSARLVVFKDIFDSCGERGCFHGFSREIDMEVRADKRDQKRRGG